MAAKKSTVFFDEYFEPLWDYVQERGIKKGEWMNRSGIGPNRWVEFARGVGILPSESGDGYLCAICGKIHTKQHKQMRVTPGYFLKLVAGAGLTPQEAELMAKSQFTVEQKAQLAIGTWIHAHQDLIMKMMEDPDKLEIVKKLYDLK